MMPSNDTDYKTLFSQLIKKQVLVLGPDITLAKVKNVTGITVDINGDVQKIDGDPQVLLQALINQFVELSGMIVKKTMESILTSYPGMIGLAASSAFGTQEIATQAPSPTPVQADAGVPQQSAAQPNSQIPEPSTMASMDLESLKMPASNPAPASDVPTVGAVPVTTNEMEDLNKALENLAKAPLSTENQNQESGVGS